MPLPLPRLDDRDYQDLVAELRGRIPVLTPEWTDLGPADPGVTMLELMAFLAENVLYRFNQIPDATWAQLLRLLAVPLRPAVPAHGLVSFRVSAVDAGGVVPAGSTVRAGAVPFETGHDVTAVPFTAAAVVKAEVNVPTDDDLLAEGLAARDALGVPDAVPVYYRPTTLPADPTAPGAQELDLTTTVDGSLWIALLPIAADVQLPLGPQSGLAGATVSVGLWPSSTFQAMADVPPCPGWNPTGTGAPTISWTVSTTDVVDEVPVYRALEVAGDRTGGLRSDGVVELRLPADLAGIGVPTPPAFGAGAGDFPPVLDGNPPVACWLRGRPIRDSRPIPALRWVDINVAEVVQALTAPSEYLGSGTGNPGQSFALAHTPVQPDLLEPVVEVEEEPGHWVPWDRVESLTVGDRDSRQWTLDAASGLVTFGDTVRARVPHPTQRIRVRRYRYGGGVEGNLPAGALTAVEFPTLPAGQGQRRPPAVTPRNPVPTVGGAAAETIGAGLDRIPGEFRRHDRAVTASDFAELAEQTPGSQVARAECLPRFDPATKATDAAGVVTVVVWPRDDPEHPDAPVPDRALLGEVCHYLDQRRLVTTELYVVPPEYRAVALSVAITVKPGYSPDAIRRWCELVIRQYLAPLPPFGPAGRGWPLGRRVHAPELEAAVLQVEGIEYVGELLVAGRDAAGKWAPGPVELAGWQVVQVATVAVVTGDVATPVGELPAGPPLPAVDGTPVLVPVPTRDSGCCR